MYAEIDGLPIFSTKIESYSAKGAYIDYSSNTIMNYVGANGSHSKIAIPIDVCNVHN